MATITVDFDQLVRGQVTIKMAVHECIECGVPFAMPQELDNRYRENHQIFFCPNGHQQHYTGKSEAEKLRDQLARERERVAWAMRDADEERARYEAEKRRHAATKGQLTRTMRRVEAGTCVHCHRTFKQLARHMRNKHDEPRTTGPWTD